MLHITGLTFVIIPVCAPWITVDVLCGYGRDCCHGIRGLFASWKCVRVVLHIRKLLPLVTEQAVDTTLTSRNLFQSLWSFSRGDSIMVRKGKPVN
jgi:hypothetical protein